MAKLDPVVRRGFFICAALGTSIAAAMVASCSGDDVTPSPTTDAAADHTTDSARDGSQQDAARQDASQGASPQDASHQDAAQDGGTDARASDGGDGGDAAHTDAATDGGSDGGSEAGACTVTTLGRLGASDGGVDGGPAPRLLFGFDDANAEVARWDTPKTWPTDGLATASGTSTEGDPCYGALAVQVTSSMPVQNASIYYNFGADTDWTGYTKLHTRIKVLTTNYATVSGAKPKVVSTDGASGWPGKEGDTLDGTVLSDGNWHEATVSTVSLSPGDYFPAKVRGINFDLMMVQTDAGTVPTATLLIDSIWLE